MSRTDRADNAAWRINVWFSEKTKPWYQDKGLLTFLYQELSWIDIENPLHPFTKEQHIKSYKDT